MTNKEEDEGTEEITKRKNNHVNHNKKNKKKKIEKSKREKKKNEERKNNRGIYNTNEKRKEKHKNDIHIKRKTNINIIRIIRNKRG